MIFFNLCLEIWVIRSLVEASSNLYAAERRGKWSYLAKRKNFALQLRFIATPFSQKSTDFCDVW